MKKILSGIAFTLLYLSAKSQPVLWNTDANNYSTGNLGIGIQTSISKLHVAVNENTLAWPVTINNQLNSGTLSGYGVGIKLKHSWNHETYKWGGIASIQEDPWANKSGLALYANEQERLRIRSNGNVGIGTDVPTHTLDVRGTGVFKDGNIIDIAISNPKGKNGIAFSPNTYNNYSRFDLINYDHSNVSNRYFQLSFNDDASGLIVKKGGSIGIGTIATGNHKLAVEGTIGAREVKVETTTWPDYVFSDDYELRSLEEVRQHIDQNGHLPEIPTEADVVANGILLGEMNAKLLQKIEELTLYVIDINEQVQKLKEENHSLKETVKNQKN
jgi:hypothetical protein